MAEYKDYTDDIEETEVRFKTDNTRKPQLYVRLKYDQIKTFNFFNAVLDAYIGLDPDFYAWLDKVKPHISKQSKRKSEESIKVRKEGQELFDDWEFTDDERKSIFEILAKEFPDM